LVDCPSLVYYTPLLSPHSKGISSLSGSGAGRLFEKEDRYFIDSKFKYVLIMVIEFKPFNTINNWVSKGSMDRADSRDVEDKTS